MSEVWRAVDGFTSYEVSDAGRVRNAKTGRVLAQTQGNSGYGQVTMHRHGKAFHRMVHRLVAMAFLRDFKQELQVNHKDGNKRNNAPGNLEMVTPRQNMLHAVHVLGFRPPVLIGADNKNARAVEQVDADGAVIRRFGSAMDAVRAGFNAACICECCRGTQRTHGGFRWRFAGEPLPLFKSMATGIRKKMKPRTPENKANSRAARYAYLARKKAEATRA